VRYVFIARNAFSTPIWRTAMRTRLHRLFSVRDGGRARGPARYWSPDAREPLMRGTLASCAEGWPDWWSRCEEPATGCTSSSSVSNFSAEAEVGPISTSLQEVKPKTKKNKKKKEKGKEKERKEKRKKGTFSGFLLSL
jgi:hypothetical protein